MAKEMAEDEIAKENSGRYINHVLQIDDYMMKYCKIKMIKLK